MANDAFEAAIGSTDFKQHDNDGNGHVSRCGRGTLSQMLTDRSLG
jgi:hypothetical protein